MNKIPDICPSCQSALTITQLSCLHCGAEVHGQFQPNVFSQLGDNDLQFVVMFVKAKGNVKEMERELGISYWTIRRKLDEIVEQLRLVDTTPSPSISDQRIVILEQLRQGVITIDEAEERLSALKRQT